MTAAAVLLSSPFHVTEELGGISIDRPVRNALIESFLINARRLTTFLRDDKPREVCAKHYLPTWTKWEFGGEIIGLVSETLAHVTYREKPQPYKVRTIINPLAAGTTEFVHQLAASESAWHPHFEPVVELLSRRLPAISNLG